jgi:hypothetical protein
MTLFKFVFLLMCQWFEISATPRARDEADFRWILVRYDSHGRYGIRDRACNGNAGQGHKSAHSQYLRHGKGSGTEFDGFLHLGQPGYGQRSPRDLPRHFRLRDVHLGANDAYLRCK